MVYTGGKYRQAHHIAPIINQCIKENNIENYYEPFCGGLSVMHKVKCENFFANDIDEDLIAFYKYLQNGGEPLKQVSKEQYYQIKEKGTPEERGNVKTMCSFGGKPWGAFVGDKIKEGRKNDKYHAALTTLQKQIPDIKKANFSNLSYEQLNFFPSSFVYCDPPYQNTYNYGRKFDHETFFNWFRDISKQYFVILSEYSAPDDFVCFKEINHKQSIDSNNNSKKVSDNLYYCDGLFKDWFENRRK